MRLKRTMERTFTQLGKGLYHCVLCQVDVGTTAGIRLHEQTEQHRIQVAKKITEKKRPRS